MKTKDKDLPEGVALNMATISVAKQRLDWVRANWAVPPQTKTWRLVMEFDGHGELLKYWESSLDKAAKELIGGGFSRVDEDAPRGGTITCKGFRLSPLQINALLAGIDHKMARSALGWLCDINGPDEPALLFRMVTIRSLHKRGLVDANFTDMRVHEGDIAGVKNLDGARHVHSPEVLKFQVWTNALGTHVLREMGFLTEDMRLSTEAA